MDQSNVIEWEESVVLSTALKKIMSNHKIIALLPVERRPESDSSLFAARGYGFGYDSFSDDLNKIGYGRRFFKPLKPETVIDLDDDFEADFREFKDDSDIDVDEDDVDVKPFASYAIKPSKKPLSRLSEFFIGNQKMGLYCRFLRGKQKQVEKFDSEPVCCEPVCCESATVLAAQSLESTLGERKAYFRLNP
ncbi:hypothetical protein K1719_024056 [Acacia pycnantha]|nr:hypothetical protein K1719_024056 [Acacia pycnantha]